MKKASWFYRFVRFIVGCYFKLIHRHKVYGLQNSKIQKAIIASNHVSFLDPPIVAISCYYPTYFFARKTLFNVPVFKTIISNLNARPVARGGMNLSSIKSICKLLLDNNNIVIFPEGTRSHDGKIGKLKAGIVTIIMQTKCSIVPAYIHGSYNVLSRNRKIPKFFCKTACVFGKPIHYKEFSNMTKKEAKEAILNRLERSIKKLQAWYEAGAKGDLP